MSMTIATLLFAATSAWGATLTTCGDDPTPSCYSSLQAAIDAAFTTDTIQLATGTYAESVVITGKDLVLTGPLTTTVRAVISGTGDPADGPALHVFGPDTSVQMNDLVIASTTTVPVRVEDGAWLEVLRATLQGGTQLDQGGVVQVRAARFTASGTDITGGTTTNGGGLLAAVDSQVILQNSTLRDGRTLGAGGAILFEGGADDSLLSLSGCLFEDNRAFAEGGAVSAWFDGAGVLLVDETTRFIDNEAARGGAFSYLSASGPGVTRAIVDSVFEGNVATEKGGAIYVINGDLSLLRSRLCDNTAEAGSAIAFEGSVTLQIANTRFLENVATKSGALYGVGSFLSLDVQYNHFVGNSGWSAPAIDVAAGASTATTVSVVLANNLVAFNTVRGAIGSAAVEFSDTHGSRLDIHHNHWHGHRFGDLEALGGQTDAVSGDPLLVNWVPDGRCDLYEGLTSYYAPNRDAGSPLEIDRDGTRSDIGAWGGASSLATAWTDFDGDRSPLVYDCAPTDPLIHPEAKDAPYDGVDSDCDLWSDYDADRDGFDAEAWGGLDCDDSEASAHPGGTELANDGIDQDCVGGDLLDGDGDGYTLDAGDCDDDDPAVHPDANDLDSGIDRDCDGITDYVVPLVPYRCTAVPGPVHRGVAVFLGLLGLFAVTRRSRPAAR